MTGGCIGGLILFEVATDLALLMIAAAFVAGLVDASAGGGGLITVPARVIKPLLGSPRPGWRCGCCFKRSAKAIRTITHGLPV